MRCYLTVVIVVGLHVASVFVLAHAADVSDSASGLNATAELTRDATTVLENMDTLLKLLNTDAALDVAEELVRGIRESPVSRARDQAYEAFLEYVKAVLLRRRDSTLPRHETVRLVCLCLYFPEQAAAFVKPTHDTTGLKELLETCLYEDDPAVSTAALDGLVRMAARDFSLVEGIMETVKKYHHLQRDMEESSAAEVDSPSRRLLYVRERLECLEEMLRRMKQGYHTWRMSDAQYLAMKQMSREELMGEIGHGSETALRILEERGITPEEAEELAQFAASAPGKYPLTVIGAVSSPAYPGEGNAEKLEQAERVAAVLIDHALDPNLHFANRVRCIGGLGRLIRPRKAKQASGDEVVVKAHLTDEVLDALEACARDAEPHVREEAQRVLRDPFLKPVRKSAEPSAAEQTEGQ